MGLTERVDVVFVGAEGRKEGRVFDLHAIFLNGLISPHTKLKLPVTAKT